MRIKALITGFLLVAGAALAQQVGGPTNWKNGPAPGNQSNSTLNGAITSTNLNTLSFTGTANSVAAQCTAYAGVSSSAGAPTFTAPSTVVFPGDGTHNGGTVICADALGDEEVYVAVTTGGTSQSISIAGSSSFAVTRYGEVFTSNRIYAPALVSSSSPTVSGCSLSGLTGGSTVFWFTAGATSCSVTVTFPGLSTPNGWICQVRDLTTPADNIGQTGAISNTAATISGTVAASDKVLVSCFGA